MMLIGIQPNLPGPTSYSEKWIEFLDRRGIGYELLDLYNLDDLYALKKYDAVMWRYSLSFPDRLIGPKILDAIENILNIPVYPNFNMRWTWEDKIKLYYLFKLHHLKTPQTWVFWDQAEALDWAAAAPYPVVFKLAAGANSSSVSLIRSREEAERVIDRMFSIGIRSTERIDEIKQGLTLRPSLRRVRDAVAHRDKDKKRQYRALIEKGYVLFQEFIDCPATYRVAVIGDRAFGYLRVNAENDFRADPKNLRYDISPDKIPPDLIRTAFDYADRAQCSCLGIDFLKGQDGFYLLEWCWTFPHKRVSQCPGHWDRNLNWHEGPMWPEEAQVEDLLAMLKKRTASSPS